MRVHMLVRKQPVAATRVFRLYGHGRRSATRRVGARITFEQLVAHIQVDLSAGQWLDPCARQPWSADHRVRTARGK